MPQCVCDAAWFRSTPRSMQVRPRTLYFPAPHDRSIANEVTLSNTSSDVLAFKARASSPQHYHVYPKLGLLNPRSEVKVTITLNTTITDAATREDKFLFEAREVPAGQVGQLKDQWSNLGPVLANAQLTCDFKAPKPPKDARVTFPPTPTKATAMAEVPAKATASPRDVAKAKAEAAAAESAIPAIERKIKSVRAEGTRADAAGGVADAQRELVMKEARELPARGGHMSVSVVVFGMLVAYLVGLLAARGLLQRFVGLQ